MKKLTCVVRNCDSDKDSDPNLSFYPIPKDANLKRQWLEILGMLEDQLNKRSKVCSKHFKKNDYDVKKFNYSVGGKTAPDPDKKSCEMITLKPDALPSQHLPPKSTFKIKISKKDNSKEIRVEEIKVKEEKDKDAPKEKIKQEMPAPKKPPFEPRRGSRTRVKKRRNSELLDSSDSEEEVKVFSKKSAPAVEEPLPRGRTQTRRAASKEALKQMQLLLGDEDDAIEIPDTDVIPHVEATPPPPRQKKTYKLSHRKSSDGNDRDVIVLKSITNRDAENTLELMCWPEELDDVQKNWISTIQKEEKELQEKLDSLINLPNVTVVHKTDLGSIIEVTEQVQSAVKASQVPVQQSIMLNNNIMIGQQNCQLVMDPRLGLVIAAPAVSTSTTTPAKTSVYPKVQVAQNLQQTPSSNTSPMTSPSPVVRGMRTRKGAGRQPSPSLPPPPKLVATTKVTPVTATPTRPATQLKNLPPPRSAPPPRAAAAPSRAAAAAQQRNAAQQQKTSAPVVKTPLGKNSAVTVTPVSTVTPTRTTRFSRDKQAVTLTPTNVRPAENNVEGGLCTGDNASGKKVIVDLTSNDDGGKAAPDSREIAFTKLQGKTYPSLVVVARPHLRAADSAVDRPKLDAKVKAVLMHTPSRFTEWLIQQGLVRSEHKCSAHLNMKLKLGMYSDVLKFPYSGGYVWISECCPQRFVSVFSGSLFEGSPHPPMVILKLLYHWACQTNIQNVTQWVKVDNQFVKGMFTWLRASCTVALHTHLRQLGGPGVKVEVGVISLGTTSQDGNQRQVKVEVLGVLEKSTKLIRLRAVEPQLDADRNYKKRFSKILEPIDQWVHPQSILVADLTVDKQTLHNMGFSNVVQAGADNTDTNRQIMEYLRRIVPRMFQNTLSLLSRQIIQQFLDELVWREWFGNTPLQAFDNMVMHLAEQTRHETSQPLLTRLNKVSQNPFRNWGIPQATAGKSVESIPPPVPSTQGQKKGAAARARKSNAAESATPNKATQSLPVEIRPPKSTSPDLPEQMVPLENYYYGTIDSYNKPPNVILNIKCPFCKSVFNNNIQLMNHLFKHAHNVSQDAQLCRYCLSSVPTAADLLKHIASSHPGETKFDNGFVCLICETQYMNPFVLGKHMSKEHCPSELPYQCGTCGYRCSNHKQAIDHFYRSHDGGSAIQCPFCLKSTTIFSSSRNIIQNINYFIQHLQKHQKKQLAKRCGKCNLWFVQKDVLKDHQTRMHVSQRGKTGMIPWSAPRNGVMVPKSKMDKYPCDAEVINFTTLTLNISKNLMCKECHSPMDTAKHFPSFESCQNPNCQYSTCCTNAMQEHNAKCNKLSNPIAPEPLPFEMFCVCGYSDKDGNQMARHLAICERKSAYPSKSKAKAATVTHSMLDVLGLVRKPEESSSTVKKYSTTEEKDKSVEDLPGTATHTEERGTKRKLLNDDYKKPQKKRKGIEKDESKDKLQNKSEDVEKNEDVQSCNKKEDTLVPAKKRKMEENKKEFKRNSLSGNIANSHDSEDLESKPKKDKEKKVDDEAESDCKEDDTETKDEEIVKSAKNSEAKVTDTEITKESVQDVEMVSEEGSESKEVETVNSEKSPENKIAEITESEDCEKTENMETETTEGKETESIESDKKESNEGEISEGSKSAEAEGSVSEETKRTEGSLIDSKETESIDDEEIEGRDEKLLESTESNEIENTGCQETESSEGNKEPESIELEETESSESKQKETVENENADTNVDDENIVNNESNEIDKVDCENKETNEDIESLDSEETENKTMEHKTVAETVAQTTNVIEEQTIDDEVKQTNDDEVKQTNDDEVKQTNDDEVKQHNEGESDGSKLDVAEKLDMETEVTVQEKDSVEVDTESEEKSQNHNTGEPELHSTGEPELHSTEEPELHSTEEPELHSTDEPEEPKSAIEHSESSNMSESTDNNKQDEIKHNEDENLTVGGDHGSHLGEVQHNDDENSVNMENHVNSAPERDTETLLEPQKVNSDITSDDIHNLLSDVVHDKSSIIHFDEIEHMDTTPRETDNITNYSGEHTKQLEGISNLNADYLESSQETNEVVEGENLHMETD